MEIYVASVISAVVGYLASLLANKPHQGFLKHIAKLFLLACLTAALIFAGLRIFTPQRSRFEGQWIERYKEGDNVIYAVAQIEYDPEAKHLKFSGYSYDAKQNLVGSWQTIQARLDDDKEYNYLFKGKSYNPDTPRQGDRHGVGNILFDSSSNHGRGNFISIRTDKGLREFELDKILDEGAARQAKDDPRGFIQKLYNDPNYLKQVTSVH